MTKILFMMARYPRLVAVLGIILAAAIAYAFVYQRGVAAERSKVLVEKYETALAGKNARIKFLEKSRAAVETAAKRDLEKARQDGEILRELLESGQSIVDGIKDEFVCVDPVSTGRLRSLFQKR